jgi:polyhydroxybutyrate depolymerase
MNRGRTALSPRQTATRCSSIPAGSMPAHALILALVVAGCGSSEETSTQSESGGAAAGGAAQGDSSGGATSTGGSVSPSGGSVSPSGGTSSTGGSVNPSGGTSATGGSVDPSGGLSATGGSVNPSGGASSTGGTAGTGGISRGGSTNLGGRTGAAGGRGGGVATGGAGGLGGNSATTGGQGGTSSATGGANATGGSTGASGDPTPSSGCGKPAPAATTAKQTMDVGGTAREYIVVYPTSYDPNHPYRLVYEFHGSGGTADENIRFQWYGIQPLSGDSVIFVAPQGLGSPAGWPNTGGQDITFVKQLVATINETYCIDTSRIFVTGFSYGGMFTNTLGCQMGDVFRAIAPASGGGPSGNCVGQVAAVVIHGSADTTVDVSSGEASRDHWLAANHCGTTTVAMEPSPCVVYEGCDAGYPVAWCEHTQGHMILSSFFGPAIWNFISQF